MTFNGPRLYSRQFYADRSFVNEPIPDNIRLNDIEGPAAVQALVTASTSKKNYPPTFAAKKFTRPLYILDADYPRQPVRMWRTKWATANPAVSVQKFNTIMRVVGCPIPPEFDDFYAAAAAAGDTDLTLCVVQPDALGGTEHDLWRCAPCDPATNDGCRYTAQGGLRITHTDQSPGYSVNRMYGGTYYTDLPTDPAKLADYEMAGWQASVTGISLAATMVTEEDCKLGRIDHALGVIVPDWLIAPGKRWPAQGYDGWATGGPVQEGMIFQLDPAVNVPALGLSRIATWCLVAAQRYGWVVRDKGGALQIEGDPDCAPYMDGIPGYRIFDGTPWDRFRLLAAGTQAAPRPTV